jgi:hypothetical protein
MSHNNCPPNRNVFSFSSSTSSSYFSSSFSSDGQTQTRSYGETAYTDPSGNTTVHRILKEPGYAARQERVEYDHMGRKIGGSGGQDGIVRRIEDVTNEEEEGDAEGLDTAEKSQSGKEPGSKTADTDTKSATKVQSHQVVNEDSEA